MRGLVKLITTFFYVGQVPFAPGTLASFVGLLLLLSLSGHPWVILVLFVALLFFGLFLSGRAEGIFGRKDPPEVVIDEICGIFIVFFMIPPYWVAIVLGFILYRLFDIIKPPPARQLEQLKGGYGIMLDDIVCGVYANLILHFLLKFTVFLKV